MSSHQLCALLGLFLLAVHAVAFEHDTDGESGETCGPEDRKCLSDKASCNDLTGECVCDPPYTYGDGYMNCYKNNSVRTEIFNDPNLKDYNGDSTGLPIPCRYFWTHVKTDLKDRSRNRVGHCYFQAYAFHQKAKGKFFVGGYDVAIRLVYDNDTEVEMSIRKYGKAYEGHYKFEVNGTDGDYLPQGDWEDDVIDFHDPTTNLKIKCEFDEQNNLAIINAKKCGVRIQFRPYDCIYRRQQPQVPHVAFGIKCAHRPMYLNKDKVVALPPAAENDDITIEDIVIPGLDQEMSLVYRALSSMADQNEPFGTDQCAIAKTKLDNCNAVTLVQAFNNCFWILKLPRFIRCYDDTDSGEDIMTLFNSCVDVYCAGASCAGVIGDIVTKGCNDLLPPHAEVDAFVSGSMCPS